MNLPLEIRIEIYRLCVPTKHIFDVVQSPTFAGQADLTADTVPVFDLWYHEQIQAVYSEDSDSQGDTTDTEGSTAEEAPFDTWDEPVEDFPPWIEFIQALLLVSRQVRDEVLDVLYGENGFRINVGQNWTHEETMTRRFSEAKIQRIKHVLLCYPQRNISLNKPLVIDRHLWQIMLPNLATLRVVAGPPSEGSGEESGEESKPYYREQEIQKWASDLPPVLQFIGRYISLSADVLVDVNENEKARDLIHRFLQRDYREVKTCIGNDLFDRDR
jgi:hypothetical protein